MTGEYKSVWRADFIPGPGIPGIASQCTSTPAICNAINPGSCEVEGDGEINETNLGDTSGHGLMYSTFHLIDLVLAGEQRQISTIEDLTLVELSFLWDVVESAQIELAGTDSNLGIIVVGSDETSSNYTLSGIYEAIDLAGQSLIVSEKYGDVNKDGIVNLDDVVLMLEALAIEQQAGLSDSQSDLNADGIVDLLDFDIVIERIN